MSDLKQHTEQFTVEEIRLALLSPKITEALIWELTTRIDLFEHFGGVFSIEFGNRLIDDMRQQRAADQNISEAYIDDLLHLIQTEHGNSQAYSDAIRELRRLNSDAAEPIFEGLFDQHVSMLRHPRTGEKCRAGCLRELKSALTSAKGGAK